jgi:flavin reductase (DIM6/NTAB) family NADH-FMN oxidoreductase RutF
MLDLPPNEWSAQPVGLWLDRWLLLTCGTLAEHNAMTVAWGSIGGMWTRPFVQVVVRPQRHTHGFLERCADFTLCAFPEHHRAALRLLGSRSGRDGDKITAAGLTRVAARTVSAPVYAEADLVLECRSLYRQRMEGNAVPPSVAQEFYPTGDFHTIWWGEILRVAIA